MNTKVRAVVAALVGAVLGFYAGTLIVVRGGIRRAIALTSS